MYVCMYNIYNSTIYSKVKTYVLMNNYINAKKKIIIYVNVIVFIMFMYLLVIIKSLNQT